MVNVEKLKAVEAGKYYGYHECFEDGLECQAENYYAPCGKATFELYPDVVMAFMDYMDKNQDLSKMSGWYQYSPLLVEYKTADVEKRAELRLLI